MNQEQATRTELLGQIAVLEDRLRQLERQHQAVVNSTSWKLTKPIRSLLNASPGAYQAVRRLLGRSQRINTIASPHVPGRLGPVTSAKVLALRGMRRIRRFVEARPRLKAGFMRAGKLVGRVNRSIPHWIETRSAPSPTERNAARPARAFTANSRFVFLDFIWQQTARPRDVSGADDTREIAAGFAEIVVRDPNRPKTPIATINMRDADDALLHILYGFSHIEPWGVWTAGGRSSVLLILPPDAPEECEVEVRAAIFEEAFSLVQAELLVDQASQGLISFDGTNPVTFTISSPTSSRTRPEGTQNLSLDKTATPDLSIIILNYNKPAMTLVSVLSILNAPIDLTYEIIVLDNGSSAENARMLRSLSLPVRTIFLGANRFFGEGNNIAAENARAPKLCFLNNDAFVTDRALDVMATALDEHADIGITGPIFRYPDQTLQEAGAFINRDGTAYQRGKFSRSFDLATLKPLDTVDYVSAACLMMRADDFWRLGGFDLRYDPAYYEDSDLCLRMASLGKRTVVARDAEVIHVENATSSDPRNRGIATDIVGRHKEIFLSRWGEWLNDRERAPMPKVVPFDAEAMRQSLEEGVDADVINCVYTPYPLVQGGGERYILGVAQMMARSKPTAVATPDEYSGLRLNTLLRDLGYQPYQSFPEVERALPKREIDRFVLMGNELLPTRPGYGDKRIYHCQFPFPQDKAHGSRRTLAENLRAYGAVVVNSEFTRGCYLRNLKQAGVAQPPLVEIVAPPVRMLTDGKINGHPKKEDLILSIGRFSPLGHAKRQDVVLEGFARAVASGQLRGWRLVMCGVVPNEPHAIAFYEQLLKRAAEVPGAEIRLAPSREQLDELFLKSKVYVSATGYGVNEKSEPWKCEHFGITVVEAASAGTVPVVHKSGGPAEIIRELGAGAQFSSLADLETALVEAARMSEDQKLRAKLINASSSFSEEAFQKGWTSVLEAI